MIPGKRSIRITTCVALLCMTAIEGAAAATERRRSGGSGSPPDLRAKHTQHSARRRPPTLPALAPNESSGSQGRRQRLKGECLAALLRADGDAVRACAPTSRLDPRSSHPRLLRHLLWIPLDVGILRCGHGGPLSTGVPNKVTRGTESLVPARSAQRDQQTGHRTVAPSDAIRETGEEARESRNRDTLRATRHGPGCTLFRIAWEALH